MLGSMLENGIGRKPDLAAAVYWYKESASKGCSDALNNLGRIYETGKTVPRDLVVASEYYLKAAELGNWDAQTNLGLELFESSP
jgi:TPR repeat protein